MKDYIFLNTIEDMVIISDYDGKILFFNQAVKDKLGYSEEEILHMHALDFNPEEDREEAESIFKDMQERKRDYCPLPIVAKDGRYIAAETRVQLVEWEGQPAIYSTVRDVSTLKAIKDQLQRSFQGSPVATMLIKAKDQKIVDINQAFLFLLGHTREEVIGKTTEEIRLYAEPHIRSLVIEEMLREQKITPMELTLLTKTGQPIEGQLSASLVTNSGDELYIASIMDITENKRIKRELTLQLEFDQILLEQSSALFKAEESRLDEVIHETLKRMGEFSGADRTYVFRFTDDHLLMNNTHEWCAPGVTPQKEMLKNLPSGMFPAWVETLQNRREVYIPDVSKLPPSWSAEKNILELQHVTTLVSLPVATESNLMGYVGLDFCSPAEVLNKESRGLLTFFANNLAAVWMKFEQNRQLQESVKRAEELASEANLANKSKDTFLANISHEIRTPLNAIIGIAHIMEQTRLSAVHARYLNIILSSAHTMLEIIGDILDLAKIESGKLTLERIPFSIHDVIDKSVKIFEYQAAYKNIELLVYVDKEIPAVLYGDPAHIGQVLNNLLSNGVKFSGSGNLTVDCTIKERNGNNVRLKIAVSDRGKGVSIEDMPKLFNEFWQAENKEEGVKGTGLGLSISRKLTEQMGGSIHAESKIGEGSTFAFDIPLDFADSTPAYEAESIDVREYSFLILDENTESRRYKAKMLEAYGIRHTIASSIPELSRMLSTDPSFDAVLIDLHPGGMEGYSVASHIAGYEEFKGSIFLLSTSFELLKHSSSESGIIEDFLPKPLTAKVFFENLAKRYFIPGTEPPEVKSLTVFSNAKVLVAEDIQINQEIIAALLSRWGIECDLVANGLETVDAVSQTRYDAVLLDIHMSGMDGIEAAKIIRSTEDEYHRTVPIIGMSANAILEYRRLYREGILSDHVLKPIDPNELLDKLTHWMPDKIKSQKEQAKNNGERYRVEPGILDVALGVRTVGGSSEIYHSLLEKYAELYKTAGDEIAQMIRRGNDKEALERLHSLKSPTGSIGGTNAFVAIERLEEQVRTGHDKDSINERVYIFIMAHGRLIREIKRYLAGRGGASQEKDIEKPETREEYAAILQELRTALTDFDPISVQSSLKKLQGNKWGEVDDKRIMLAKKAIENYKYKTALRILKGGKLWERGKEG